MYHLSGPRRWWWWGWGQGGLDFFSTRGEKERTRERDRERENPIFPLDSYPIQFNILRTKSSSYPVKSIWPERGSESDLELLMRYLGSLL